MKKMQQRNKIHGVYLHTIHKIFRRLNVNNSIDNSYLSPVDAG